MRALIYLRVSTDKQDTENQIEACRQLIAREGWTVVGVERAEGQHGDDDENPVKRAVLLAAGRREFDVIVVWALDRWTRSGIGGLFADLEALQRVGVRLVSAKEPWTAAPGFGELLMAIVAWVAKLELERRRERTREAVERRKRELAERGRFVSKTGHVRTSLGRPRVDVPPRALAFLRDRLREGNSLRVAQRLLAEAGMGTFSLGTLSRAVQKSPPETHSAE